MDSESGAFVIVAMLAWDLLRIRVGHSADPDDAFMFWALEAGLVDRRGLEFEQVVSDIETLNGWATEGTLEVTAISMGAYPAVADRYVLLPHGASMGIGYGPIVVAREELDLREVEIAIPGERTTAYFVLRLALGADLRVREVPFEAILDEVVSGRADAGLVIHEGQLTYAEAGLHKLLDLGEWWHGETGLPLPLGVNVARSDLGERLADVSAVLGDAIRVGLEHREDALAYAQRFGRGIDRETADRFVAMYVNELTCDYGEVGRRAVAELLRRAGTGIQATYA
jgi:1,4-dihydroxy-6-naphthoate synthase